jgi:hypothetical protein
MKKQDSSKDVMDDAGEKSSTNNLSDRSVGMGPHCNSKERE